MELKGEYRLPASRETVWEQLNDPQTLQDCIPGCESLEKNDDDTMNAKVKVKIGPMKVTFNGEVSLQNIDAPKSYSIVGEGKGGIAGFAKGRADVHLEEAGPDETILTYNVDAQVGGKMAQLGGRLIESTSKKLAAEFFDCFARKIAGEDATVEGETVTV
ncbi:carbon monoxide dehydrogenase [Fulvimarina endophytica]|uniref:Carbon monoxide dehydrogenase n=1 Tax=Fulvimarina endophytica TaxID=2293836 RepID=A0A371X1M6_9HYPH|nr:carbon monoxide dehydrogenase subunit G [Fulvimarina endophytica]RFC63109.1 carbon monoxide dehydrogenase [Fulvimarina endophytica]